jgi:hypothetical protein
LFLRSALQCSARDAEERRSMWIDGNCGTNFDLSAYLRSL